MKKFIDSVDLVNTVVSSSVESVELDMTHMDRLGAELHNNGSSLVAVIYFQGSNDKENWTRIDAANFGVLNATTVTTAVLNQTPFLFKWARLEVVHAGGSGLLNAHVTAKARGED